MSRTILPLFFLIASLSVGLLSAATVPCSSGSCRVERSRNVERERVSRERRVERVRIGRR